jgi:hypothetical protein
VWTNAGTSARLSGLQNPATKRIDDIDPDKIVRRDILLHFPHDIARKLRSRAFTRSDKEVGADIKMVYIICRA